MGSAADAYDPCRRTACGELLTGAVHELAARRLVQLAGGPRDPAEELGRVFEEVERVAAAPTPSALTAVAGRALAAYACRRGRSLSGSIVSVSLELDRRFAACEAGQAGYPLNLTGLGRSGQRGLESGLIPFSVTHALERIIESAVLVATVVEPSWAPGAYAVRPQPRRSTTAEVQALLARSLAARQNAAIDFALEELDCHRDRDVVAFEQLQCVVLALRPAVDVEGLVAHAHALLSSIDEDVELEAELRAAAGIIDGSGLASDGTLALGEAVGSVTRDAAGLVSSLHRTVAGLDSGGHSADVARSVLHVALVVAWCVEHGRVRSGLITVADRPAVPWC